MFRREIIIKAVSSLIFAMVNFSVVAQTVVGQAKKITTTLSGWYFALFPIALIFVAVQYKKNNPNAEKMLWSCLGGAFLVVVCASIGLAIR